MRRGFLTLACVVAFATNLAAGEEPKPWVKVKPKVLPAGAVIPKITFEAKMPAEAPAGSLLEIEIPYHFGLPQTGNRNADNYLHGDSRLALGAEVLNTSTYVVRGFVKKTIKKGKKVKLFLTREHTHPFDHKEKAFGTRLLGPPGRGGERETLAEGQATVVHIPGGPPAQLRVVAPTCVTPGEPFAAKIAVLDKNNNPAGSVWKGELVFTGDGVEGPRALKMSKKENNYVEVAGFTASEVGVYRVAAQGRGLTGRSNPIVCRQNWERRIYWGDEHGHSAFSDGMRQPDEFFDYGRYVALLDATFLTDHAECLYGDEWPTFVEIANAKNDPPAFVTLVAYEWTSDAWSGGYGHRCVFLRGDGGSYYNSNNEGSNTPAKLWAKYRPGEVVMIPHHTLAGFRWGNVDPAYERCVEIVSHWGVSEYEGNPFWKKRTWKGGGVVDALDSYCLLGFVGGGDNHNGAPGQNRGPSRMRHMWYIGGITAFLAEENTRPAIFDALYDRRVYATAGNRDFIDFEVDGARMASITPVADAPLVEGEVATEDAVKSLEVVRGGETVYTVPTAAGRDYAKFTWRDEGYDGSPTYYYLRVISEDGHVAYATPVWVARGEWLTIDRDVGRELAPGQYLAFPPPAARDFENYAIRLKAAASAPGEVKVIADGAVAATAEAGEGQQEITLQFKTAPQKWDVRLSYDGADPLNVTEACVFPYPWQEPRWVGRWWTFEAEKTKKTAKGNKTEDTFASAGSALVVSPADNLYEKLVLWGPYQVLERGEYQAHFYLRADGDPTSSKPAAEISVAVAPAGASQPPAPTTAKTLSVASLARDPGYKKFTLDFELLEKSRCEYKVKYIGNAIVYVDKVDVQQVAYE